MIMNYKFEAYSIVAVIILISGLLRLYIYYKAFNISILPFLEPDEIGTIFFDNLLYFLLFAALNTTIFVLFYSPVQNNIGDLEELPFNKRAKKYGLLKPKKIIAFVLLTSLMFFFYWNSDRIQLYEFLLWIMLVVIALYLNPIVILEINRSIKQKGVELNHLSVYFLVAALNLFAFAGLSGYNEANKVKNHEYYSGTEFSIDNGGLFVSDEKNFYIGKTKQFVFFYDKENQETKVVPIGKITTMKYN